MAQIRQSGGAEFWRRFYDIRVTIFNGADDEKIGQVGYVVTITRPMEIEYRRESIASNPDLVAFSASAAISATQSIPTILRGYYEGRE